MIPSCCANGSPSPVKRILNILHSMGERVEAHTRTENALFDERMCTCKQQGATLEQTVAVAKEKMPQLLSSVDEARSVVAQLESDIQHHKASLQLAETALQEQESLRALEAETFRQRSAEMSTSIKRLRDAIAAVRNGQGSAKETTAVLLQSRSLLATVRKVIQSVSSDRLREQDREQMASLLEFLEQADQGAGESSSDIGEISGILQQILEDLKSDLAKLQQNEETSSAQHGALQHAKKKEMQTLSATIQEKEDRLSNTEVEVVQLKKQLRSFQASYSSDQQLLASLTTACNDRKEEHAKIVKDLSLELASIHEATEILQNGQATGLFRQPMPASRAVSLVQLSSSTSDMHTPDMLANQVTHMLHQLSLGHAAGDKFSALAANIAHAAIDAAASHYESHSGRASTGRAKAPFGWGKVSSLIGHMMELLDKDQEDDDLKKQMCIGSLKREGDHVQSLQGDIEARDADLATAEEQHATVAKDMVSLRKGIEALDNSVARDTEQRREAHENFAKLLADNHAAIDVLRLARTRLERTYGSNSLVQAAAPAVATPAAAPSRAAETGASFGELGELFFGAQTMSQHGVAVRHEEGVLAQQLQPRLQGEGSGVIKMIVQIEADLQKESDDAKAAEETDQREYEGLMAAASAKREADAKAIADKAAIVAELSESAGRLRKKRKALRGELEQAQVVVASLKEDCDWSLEHYEHRKHARSDEKQALSKTLEVLRGVKYDFVQTHQLEAPLRPHSIG